jgi:hypothetical protein
MERRGRKGSSCARSEEMETDRKKMAGYCLTGQSKQRAVVLMEEEEEYGICIPSIKLNKLSLSYHMKNVKLRPQLHIPHIKSCLM